MTLRIFSFVAALLLLTGCPATLAPSTADLQHVHELYATEFTSLADAVPTPDNEPSAKQPSSGEAFIQSLRALNDYRAKHPDKILELAHLDVLEGMIYLQSGRFGLARAVVPNVERAGTTLSATTSTRRSTPGNVPASSTVRDALFAKNFRSLLDGWSATRNGESTSEDFERVFQSIAQSLTEESPPSLRLTRDHGALYLATSASIFQAWAHARDSMRVHLEPTGEKLRALEQRRIQRYSAARDLLARFLTDAERAVRPADDLAGQTPQGRLRYVAWYHFFNDAPAAP